MKLQFPFSSSLKKTPFYYSKFYNFPFPIFEERKITNEIIRKLILISNSRYDYIQPSNIVSRPLQERYTRRIALGHAPNIPWGTINRRRQGIERIVSSSRPTPFLRGIQFLEEKLSLYPRRGWTNGARNRVARSLSCYGINDACLPSSRFSQPPGAWIKRGPMDGMVEAFRRIRNGRAVVSDTIGTSHGPDRNKIYDARDRRGWIMHGANSLW